MYTCQYVYIDVLLQDLWLYVAVKIQMPWCMYIHVRVCIQMYWSASQSLATCCCSEWGVTYTCTCMKLCVYRCTDLLQDLWPHVAVKIQVSCMYIHTRQYVHIDVPICLRISGRMLLLTLRCHVRKYIHVNMLIYMYRSASQSPAPRCCWHSGVVSVCMYTHVCVYTSIFLHKCTDLP